jgi:hypothetical protein
MTFAVTKTFFGARGRRVLFENLPRALATIPHPPSGCVHPELLAAARRVYAGKL